MLGFVLFELFAKLHLKTARLGQQTLQDLRDSFLLALGRWEELETLWNG
ncbi:MAG: hypothetical protein KF791_00105 [Verrucomicrobiae bacterium]|nr:hypothetical protein [Verrucomicrobiae bacterium]